jgi:putative membrane protein
VWLLHVIVLWAWHVPALYDAAVRDPLLHALEHGSLLVSATAFWWMTLRPRDHHGLGALAAMLALFAGAGQSTALGALLTLASEPSFLTHADTTARWGLTPLEDQQLAGLLMWVVGGLGYMIAAFVVTAAALRRGAGPETEPAALNACGRDRP